MGRYNAGKHSCSYFLPRIIEVTMNNIGECGVTEYLYSMAQNFERLKNINNPKETMQFLIPYTNMVR